MNEYWAEFDARLARLVALRDELKSELVALEQIPDVAPIFYWRLKLAGQKLDSAILYLKATRQPDDAA